MINSLLFSICFILIFKVRIIYLALNNIKLFDFIKYMIFKNFGKIMYHIGEICHIYIRPHLLPLFFRITLHSCSNMLLDQLYKKNQFRKFVPHPCSAWKLENCHLKSNFQNYGRMVVDSLKRSSQRVEKENI